MFCQIKVYRFLTHLSQWSFTL